MSDSGKAVFLSYASQDAEAARKICDALHAAGIEVWFDQSELVGGDAWDQKIRKQIGSCALLIPIISASTQARREGYFRLEWRLAVERMRQMDDDLPFLVPVVIDDTKDTEAFVPEKFREVQWTRLKGGEPLPAFVGRVQKLLGASAVGAASRDGGNTRGRAPGGAVRRTRPRWLVPVILGTVIMAVAAVWLGRKPAPDPAAPDPKSQTPARAEARELLTKAWELLNRTGLSRPELEIADGLLKRAAELALDDPEVWAAWAHVDAWYVYHNLDPSPDRREGARQKSARALRLDARSFEARLADACYIVRATGTQPGTGRGSEMLPMAEQTLRDLVRERPDDHRPRFALGILLRNAGRFDEGVAEFERMAQLPGRAATAWNEIGWLRQFAGEFQLAVEAADRSIAVQPYYGNLLLRLGLARSWTGDLELAKAAAAQLPLSVKTEEVFAANTVELFRWRREPAEMLRILEAVPRAWIASQGFNGPKFFLVAQAHRMAGREDAAQLGWREALRLIEQRLEQEPASAPLLTLKARTLWALGRQQEARQTARLAESFGAADNLDLLLELGELDRALTVLHELTVAALTDQRLTTSWAQLKLNPRFDPVRSDPRFQRLLAQAEADPRRNPHASRTPVSGLPPPPQPPVADAKSVAVLAFANLSDDKGNEYFSDGISEELLNVLAKVPGLKVSARTSAFYFKGKEVPIPEIARQLGVAYVVEGSVRKQGDKVRITAQLIKAADGFHVWSDTFTRDLKDIFAVQDEIAGLISQQLQVKLGSSGPVRSVNPEALNLLLEARYHWNERGEQNFDRAESLLRRALELDPGFARAHAALADVWLMRATYRLLDGGADVAAELQNLRNSATRSTEMDPSLVDPIAARAYGLMLENRMEESGRLFAEVLARSPDNPTFLYWRGLYLMNQGDFLGAREAYEKARRYDPMSFIIWHNSAECAHALGHYREAAVLAARANEVRKGGFVQSVASRATALWLAGEQEPALALARSTRQPELQQLRWVTGAYAVWILRQAGFEAEAAAYEAEELPKLPARSYQRGFLLAGQGRFTEAYPYLESMPPYIFYLLATSVLFDPCREDPQFKALVEKLHWTKSYAKARAARLESLANLEAGP